MAYTVYVGLIHLRLEAPKELSSHRAVEHFVSKLVP